MNSTNQIQAASFGRRIIAFLIDHFIIVFISMIPFILNFNLISDQPEKIFNRFYLIFVFAFILYLLKDIVFGVSVGKWTVGLAVREYSNNKERPKIIKLMIRNVLTFLWPVEIIMILFSKTQRKIGDRLAKTEVYTVSNRIRARKIAIVMILLFVIFISTIFFSVINIMQNSSSYKTAIDYIEKDQSIQREVGNIEGYGNFPMGNISVSNGYGEANLVINVKGEKRNIKVYVYLEKQPGSEWIVKKLDY